MHAENLVLAVAQAPERLVVTGKESAFANTKLEIDIKTRTRRTSQSVAGSHKQTNKQTNNNNNNDTYRAESVLRQPMSRPGFQHLEC